MGERMKHKFYTDVSGSVALRVVLCVLSLVVIAIATFWFLSNFRNEQAEDLRLARRFSEDGLQEAFIKLTESPEWSTSFTSGPYEEGGSYSVDFAREVRDDGILYLTVTSTGRSGPITQIAERTVRFVAEVSESGDTTWVPMSLAEEMPAFDEEISEEGEEGDTPQDGDGDAADEAADDA